MNESPFKLPLKWKLLPNKAGALSSLDNGKILRWLTRLYPVFYIPELVNRLLSMGEFLKKNKVIGDANAIHIVTPQEKTVISCERLFNEDMIYWAFTHIEKPERLGVATLFVADHQIWHRRLGHMSDNALSKMPRSMKKFPKHIALKKSKPICKGCAEGKMKSKSFPESTTRAMECFELIHSDFKTLPMISYHKHKYFIVFVDDKSSVHWVICLKTKADAKQAVKEFLAYVQTQFSTSVKRWRIDAGGEFLNLDLINMIKDLGILIEQSVPYTHQQNGHVEHAIHTIMEKAQAICFTACLPQSWWEFCVEHAAHLINQTPIARLDWITPFEAMKGVKPDISHL